MGRTVNITLGLILLLFITSVFSPVISAYDPDAIDLDSLRQPPSYRHVFGTDNKGRDIFARVLSGGRLSIGISFFAAAISMLIGLSVGLTAGYYRGVADTLCMAFVDLILSFPSLILAIGISVLMPPGIYTVVIALASVSWASFARLIRGHVLSVREAPFIEAARAIGCSDLRIILFHLLPQCLPLALVLAGMKLGGFILAEAALGFLGLGVQPPTATWGSMVSANRSFLSSGPWMVMAPGIFIAVTALCFNLMGDALRDRFETVKERLRFY